jgi:hypothetical protein
MQRDKEYNSEGKNEWEKERTNRERRDCFVSFTEEDFWNNKRNFHKVATTVVVGASICSLWIRGQHTLLQISRQQSL